LKSEKCKLQICAARGLPRRVVAARNDNQAACFAICILQYPNTPTPHCQSLLTRSLAPSLPHTPAFPPPYLPTLSSPQVSAAFPCG